MIIQRYVNGEKISREELKALSVAEDTRNQVTGAVMSARRKLKEQMNKASAELVAKKTVDNGGAIG